MPEVVRRMTSTLDELDKAANWLLESSMGCRVWLFRGELGAGKTTLIKSVCTALGVVSNMSSPTFSIVNEYATHAGGRVCHFDFYRLRNEQEASEIGVEEYLDSGDYCLIEWPEKVPSITSFRHLSVSIQEAGPQQRTIEYQIHD